MALSSIRRVCPAFCDTGVYSCISRILWNSATPSCGTYSQFYSTKSDEASPEGKDGSTLSNDTVNPVFVNRNPRNLEHMAIARRRKGWRFQYPTVEYYHRLIFEKSKRHIAAYIEHTSGKIVISASTKEYAIAKQLYSPSDKSAAANLGKVLAQRCSEAGIVCMIELEPETGEESAKYQEFIKAVKEGGVELSEPEEVLPDYEPGINYEDDFEYGDLLRRQALVRDSESKTRKLRTLRKKNKVNTELMLKSEDPLYEQRILFAKWNRSKWTQ